MKPHEIQQDGVDGMVRLQSYHIECWLPLGACIGENQLGAMIFDNESDLGYLLQQFELLSWFGKCF